MNGRLQQTVMGKSSGQGFTLVELMVAMVLGLILIAGVVSVFLANKQSYRSNQALSEIQDGSRVAFELMAREIRMAGLTGCGNLGRVANVVNPVGAGGTPDWWETWDNAVHGYDDNQADPAVTTGGSEGDRVAGTDSLELIGIGGSDLSVASHNPVSAQFKLNEATADIQAGDIIVVCDPDHAAITQVTNYNSANVTLVHNTGTGYPGNCSKGLGYPTDCSSVNGNSYTFGANSQLAKLSAVDWYIGNNHAGGRSLYRRTLTNNAGVLQTPATEMVRNVTNMQILYHDTSSGAVNPNGFVTAAQVVSWAGVDAVRITLTLQSAFQRAGTDQQPLTRSFTTTIALRNRLN